MGIFVTLPEELVTFNQALGVTFKMLLTKAPQGILQDTEAANFSLLMEGGKERENRGCKTYCSLFAVYYLQKAS